MNRYLALVLCVMVVLGLCSCREGEEESLSSRGSSSLQAEMFSPAEEPQSIVFEPLFGKTLVDQKDQEYGSGVLDGKVVGVYFSAHWCPPCRYFTPNLVSFYREMKKAGNPFEVVFVSSDRSAKDMQIYMKDMDMPWLAVPFRERGIRQMLAQRYPMPGIPTLIILNQQGEVLSNTGRADVMQRGAKAYAEWQLVDNSAETVDTP